MGRDEEVSERMEVSRVAYRTRQCVVLLGLLS